MNRQTQLTFYWSGSIWWQMHWSSWTLVETLTKCLRCTVPRGKCEKKNMVLNILVISLVPSLFCKKKITDAMWRKESMYWPCCCKLVREKLTWSDCFLLLSFQEIIRRGFELGNDTWWVLTFNSQILRTLLSLLYLVDCIRRLAHKTKYIYHLLEVVFSEVTVHDDVKYG